MCKISHFGILGDNYKDNTGHDQVKSEVEGDV